MTQVTEERQGQLQAAATQTAAKLEAFRVGLTDDERFILGMAVWQVMDEGADGNQSVAGFGLYFADRNPFGRFGRDLSRTIDLRVTIGAVKGIAGAIADSARSRIPSDPTPGSSTVFPGSRGL